MPLPNRDYVPTPNRKTVVDFAISTQVTLKRPAQNIYRYGRQIGKGVTKNQLQSSDNRGSVWSGEGVDQLPDGCWMLSSYQRWLGSYTFSTASNEIIFGMGSQYAVGMNTGVVVQRAPSELPGSEIGAGIAPNSATGIRKKVVAGANWNSNLSSDEVAYAIPLEPGASNNPDVGIHRVVTDLATQGPNAAFVLNFGAPRQWYGFYTNFINFYFGGACPVYPASERGGEFCLKLFGSGAARLYEYDKNKAWQGRFNFRWADRHAATQRVYSVGIIPYAWDRIGFFCKTTETPQGIEDIAVPWGGHAGYTGDLYRDVFSMTDHYHLQSATGPGVCRLDVANTYRNVVTANKGKFTAEGYITDGVIVIDHDLPIATPITVTTYSYLPPGTTITHVVYDASDNSALTYDPFTGTWASNLGSRAYYVRFHLTTTNRYTSPVLLGYNLGVGGTLHTVLATPISPAILESVSITGPDVKCDHESASVTVQDTVDNLSGTLGNRGRIHSKIKIIDTTDDSLIGYIFEGETSKSPNKLVGKPWRDKEYPSDQWKEYDATFVGMWARLEDQFHAGRVQNFRVDPYGAVDLRGQPKPWRVTDVIKWLLNNAGWPANQINVPNYDTRLFPSPELGINDYMILPSARYSDLIQRLALDFLGQYLIWDPNANAGGNDGMWRLISTPPTFTNVLAKFVTRRAEDAQGRLATHPGTYEANTFWIEEGTYQEWIEPPEFNYISVSTVGQLLPTDNGTKMRYTNFLQNEASINNPSSPDYLEGRWVPAYIIDPFIGGGEPWEVQNAVDLVTRRTYDLAAHARRWIAFRAQLLMVADNIDPLRVYRRPLRLADVITVDGYECLVRSCNPDYDSDYYQAANYEVLRLS